MESTYNDIWERKLKGLEEKHKPNCRCRCCEASRLLRGGEQFLDVGCGNGFLISLLENKYKQFYGVDISNIALEKASKKGIKTFLVNMDKDPLPFNDSFFDAITCLDVMEHVLDPNHLLREINRVLTPDGVVIVTTPNIRCVRNIMPLIFFGRFPRTSADNEAYDGGHIHYFARKNLTELLVSNGFRPVKTSFIRDSFVGDFMYRGTIVKGKKCPKNARLNLTI